MPQNDWIDLEKVWEKCIEQGAGRLERLPTGIPSLDAALDGGLAPGLTVLGGIPGVGKSTLALQIAMSVAEKGHPVLYFSLEMPANYILFKAANRKAHKSGHSLDITVNSLLNGPLNPGQREIVESIKPSFPFQNLHICTKALSASGILEQVQAFQKQRPDQGKKFPKPLVIIDYLQILRPEKYSPSDKQAVESSLSCLMQLAHNLDGVSGQQDIDTGDGLPVLLISSLNRSSYKGEMETGAFKETGGIEYSADLLMGLQFRACRSDGFDLKQEQKRSPREVELIILKNRYGCSGNTVPLQYDPRHDDFYPPEEEDPRADVPTPKGADPQLRKPAQEGGTPPASAARTPSAATDPGRSDGRFAPSFLCIINNTKVAREIRKGQCKMPEDEGEDKSASAHYSLSEPLSSLDCRVSDAIYTVYQSLGKQSKKELSLRAILYALTGSKHTALTGSMRDLLKNSIQHMQKVTFHLDCTDELHEWKRLDSEREWNYKGPFLAIKHFDEKNIYLPDTDAQDYGILPLYTYGKEINHLLKISSKLLDVVDVGKQGGKHMNNQEDHPRMTNTKDNICLKWFLAHRMEVIKYGIHDMREISFRPGRNLLSELRVSASDENYKQRVIRLHRSAVVILKYYQQIGYIDGFNEKPGRGDAPPTIQIGRVNKI